MLSLRVTALAVLFASAASVSSIAAPVGQRGDPQDMDRSIKPGDDFYRYANGGWLGRTSIPAGQSSVDTRAMIGEKTSIRVRALLEEAATARATQGSNTQKVGDYYAAIADQKSIEAKGLTPLAGEMATIAAIHDKASLSAYLGATLNSDVDGLTANADHVFSLWINQGFEDWEHNLPYLLPGGLGMPARDDYIDASPTMAALRAQYQAHIAAILKLAGVADAEGKAERILALEIRMAQAQASDADATDVFKQNNPWKRPDFSVKAPGMDWGAYFRSAGLAAQTDFIVSQPSSVIGTSALVASESVDVWKDYLRFHLIEHYASVLPKTVAGEDFAFYGTILSGSQQAPERATVAAAATNAALGDAVGQLYTQRYFNAEAKAKASAMAANLIAAYRARMANLTWMSAETKKKALVKLDAFKIGIGYPDVWIDYATLDVVRGDAFGNRRRAEEFTRLRNIARLKQPVDPVDWGINAQIPGAIIMFSPNVEVFTAGILQPPYFDSDGDAASNYGSAGAAMAHEISHSFDELGNLYDAHGRPGKWWTGEDEAHYRAAASRMAAQFDGYCPLPDLCVKGKQVLTENISDLAGLLIAHDAYMLSLNGKVDAVIDGLTGEQRFFIAYSQRWRKVQSEAALRRQIMTDTHSPGPYRSDTVRNVDAWYKAFGIAPGDKLYLKPEDRVEIW